jgi:hypothetical protein
VAHAGDAFRNANEIEQKIEGGKRRTRRSPSDIDGVPQFESHVRDKPWTERVRKRNGEGRSLSVRKVPHCSDKRETAQKLF